MEIKTTFNIGDLCYKISKEKDRIDEFLIDGIQINVNPMGYILEYYFSKSHMFENEKLRVSFGDLFRTKEEATEKAIEIIENQYFDKVKSLEEDLTKQ